MSTKGKGVKGDRANSLLYLKCPNIRKEELMKRFLILLITLIFIPAATALASEPVRPIQPDLVLARLTMSPYNPKLGDAVTFRVLVINESATTAPSSDL